MDAMKQLKIAKNGYILMSVLFMILGACLIIWPDCSIFFQRRVLSGVSV